MTTEATSGATPSDHYQEERVVVKLLARLRDDFQDMRKRMDNRLGRKADGTPQDVEPRNTFLPGGVFSQSVGYFTRTADYAREQETIIEEMLLAQLKRFPIYIQFLQHVKGLGPVSAAWIVGELDIHRADTVSKFWQFTGLNPGMVRGKQRVKEGKGGKKKAEFIVTDTMVRGDKLTHGFVAPFNQRLRTALCGVLADSFIKCQSPYALDYYYPYKERLEREQNLINGDDKAWCDVSKGRRHQAAVRYMIKMFEKDLYVHWRTIEGLPVRPSYQEEYLGHPVGN